MLYFTSVIGTKERKIAKSNPENQENRMRMGTNRQEILKNPNLNAHTALEFVSVGVGCFALTLIESVGILSSLVQDGYFEESRLTKQKKNMSVPAIKSALLSLCLCNVLAKSDGRYTLTALGFELTKYIGLVTMVFDGYGELMAKGVPIAAGKITHPEKHLNGAAIALSSIQFGEKVDEIVLETIKKLRLKGTICDLGCGSANRLVKLCKETALPGLGLDASQEALKIARTRSEKYPSINIEYGDATNLEGVWEDVQILMQCFMTHDISPDETFVRVLSSYKNNFPNLKYFMIVDIVAPEENFSSHMPAFDYVHGLQGIETRKYDEYTSLFGKSGYHIAKEIPIDMPNTYLWILKPTI